MAAIAVACLAATASTGEVAAAGHLVPSQHGLRAASFGAAAAEYERGRPSYPAEAIDWLLPRGARRVLDLGAGTGKLTRQLHQRGLDVVAVEPSAGMREQIARLLPEVECRGGTAEAIPLPDGSVDVVLCAQAWHWVDPQRAVPEVARVLSRGGRLGLIWNKRDERVDWVKQLGIIMHGNDNRAETPVVGPPFAPPERRDFEWAHLTSPDAIVDLVASRSYVITLPAEARSALLAAVRELIDTHPDLRGAAEISLPYIAESHRTDLALN